MNEESLKNFINVPQLVGEASTVHGINKLKDRKRTKQAKVQADMKPTSVNEIININNEFLDKFGVDIVNDLIFKIPEDDISNDHERNISLDFKIL